MHISDDLNNGENSDCSINGTVGREIKLAAKVIADAIRNPAAGFAAMGLAVADSGGEANWFRNLTGRLWQHITHNGLAVYVILCHIGTEHFYIALAAVQNNPFAEYGYAVYNNGACR